MGEQETTKRVIKVYELTCKLCLRKFWITKDLNLWSNLEKDLCLLCEIDLIAEGLLYNKIRGQNVELTLK